MQNIYKQQGVNLISLMIAIVIGLLGIAASFSLFTHLSVTSEKHAQFDAVISKVDSIKVLLQLDIQEAGYGIEEASKDLHLFVSSDTLIWRYQDDTASGKQFYCSGLQDALIGSQRQIIKLEKQICDQTDVLENITGWSTQTLATFKQLNQVLSFELDNSGEPAICWPYNNNKGRLRHKLTSTVNMAMPFGEDNHIASIETCLINLIPPTS